MKKNQHSLSKREGQTVFKPLRAGPFSIAWSSTVTGSKPSEWPSHQKMSKTPFRKISWTGTFASSASKALLHGQGVWMACFSREEERHWKCQEKGKVRQSITVPCAMVNAW